MPDDNFFYIDRPIVPSVQQTLIDIDAISEIAVGGSFDDISAGYSFDAVEVKDADGKIDGTLLYVPGISFEELLAPTETEIGIAEADEELEKSIVVSDDIDEAVDQVSDSLLEKQTKRVFELHEGKAHLTEEDQQIIERAENYVVFGDMEEKDFQVVNDLIDLTLRLAERNRVQYEMLSEIDDDVKSTED